MAQTSGEIPQDKLDAYDRLIAAHPEIQRKGKSSPCTSLNGHMFTYLDKSGSMGIRAALLFHLAQFNVWTLLRYSALCC